MIRTTIFPGRYVQGFDAMQRLGSECSRFGKKVFYICDPFVHENLFSRFHDQLAGEVDVIIEKFGGECSDEEIERLADTARKEDRELIAGLGGGKTLDTAKAVAHELNVPAAIVPTLASLFLTDKPRDIIDEVYCFCEAVGLPTSLAEIGLLNASDEVLLRVAEAACAADETIHNEPMPLNAEMVLAALKAADACGEDRKTVIMR